MTNPFKGRRRPIRRILYILLAIGLIWLAWHPHHWHTGGDPCNPVGSYYCGSSNWQW
ncbi:hypothetical protein ACFOSC_21890 [Streptantibioticus rubrisoli]|uniref:Uncharacterized protein n=1 Tax=Streptantibioticus rubrisoli TaxID=1387313 RepID=A0ABT1P5G3_9ACTN|nr:hypothetical protein [Streptantibioticus rubrisoli]MCQ4040612.1 hypothetical protein [Streptantibioticus rubrisoli]